MSGIEIRVPAEDEVRRFLETTEASFSSGAHPDDLERDTKMLERERMLAAYDGGAMVGTAGDFGLTLTIPGGELPAAGVTLVGVLPSHRRRGVLTQLMRRQFEQARSRGEPLAILWASEEPIYGRFGYGMATLRTWIDADRDRMAFRGAPEPVGAVRLLADDEARQLLPPLYERVRRELPGTLLRSQAWWEVYRLADPEHRRRGAGPRFVALLELDGRPEAYALYRVKHSWDEGFPGSRLHVWEAVAASPLGHREIWRFLFGVDLVARVESWFLPADDPLFLLVTEPRRLRIRVADGLWLRVLDVERALAARSYAGDGGLSLELRDSFVPDNEGVWTLEGGEVRRGGEAELRLDVADLGSAYLGGFSFAQLAAAGRVEELRAGAVERADALFRTPRPPWCPEVF